MRSPARSAARRALAGSLVLSCCALAAPPARADDPPRAERADLLQDGAGREGPDASTGPDAQAQDERAAREALRRGLGWLAEQQARFEDGSFPSAGATQNVPVAVVSLAALAFMSGGSTPDRGPHGKSIALAVDYLLAHTDLAPDSPQRGYVSSEGDGLSRMHGHAFAALALAQAWSMSPRTPRGRRVEEALRASIDLIQRSQGLEGGWFYYPKASAEHENSVTVVLVQALRAARGAGVSIDPAVIAKAVDYIRRCQDEDGSFRYGLTDAQTSAALTAAGLSTLNSAGVYTGGEVERAVEALWRRLGYREDEPDAESARFPFYERLYLAQALWQHSDLRLFERWFGGERRRLLSTQKADGSWSDAQFGDCYATAVNCLVLAIPDGLLPIFQR